MTLTPERWQRARDVLHEAMEMEEEDRSEFLDSQCASDPSLRAELKELLAAEGEIDSSFLEKPALAHASPHTQTSDQASVLPSGTKLGIYVIQSLIGAGGMGEVYRARDASLKRDVAVKVLPASFSRDPDRLRRFQLEAEAAAALNHPNILSIFAIGQQDDSPYIVTELLDGETLRERLRRGALKLRDSIDIAIQTAKGLAAAHEKGIAHRDLKPENLFLAKDGRVKILDFGLAKLLQPTTGSDTPTVSLRDQTDAGRVLGTVGYMSPEQVRGEPADTRSDIFSLGCVLYEMLTGKRAFRKPSSVETMNAILNEDPPAASDIPRTIPPALERVVHRCLEKLPDRRFQSASDLAFALDALTGSGIGNESAPSKTPTRQSIRISPKLLSAVAVILLFAGALYFWWRSSAVPRVSNFAQITHDGQPKSILGVDGSRLYISVADRDYSGLAEIHTSGGGYKKLSGLPGSDMIPVALSPDGSSLLLAQDLSMGGVGPLWSVAILGGSPRRLADIQGNAGNWSPDGSRLTYTTLNSVFVADADGSGSRKIVTLPDPVYFTGAIWSPDGSRIRFIASKTIDTPSGFYYEVSPDGSGLHRLFPGWHDPPAWECCGVWTADGKYFVFVSGKQLWAVSERTGLLHSSPKPIQLTSSPIPLGSPFPSADGKKLFVTGYVSRGELTRYDLVSKSLTSYFGGISAEYLDFSRDGHWVTYVSYPDGILWRSRLDGSERLQLSFPPIYAMVPRWSPDGTQITFMDGALGKQQQIYVVSAKGGNPRLLLLDDKISQADPTWSPDGSKILFGSNSNDPSAAIRILDLYTNQVSTLPGSKGMFSPRWSPDGKLVVATDYDSTQLKLFDFQSQHWTELLRASVGWLAWSKDNKYVYFMQWSGTNGIYRVRLSDHQVERLEDLSNVLLAGFQGSWFSLAPDGSPLILRNTGTADIYSLDWEEP
jgi:serine/threonine protein kinase